MPFVEPQFIDTDPAAVEAAMVADYEARTGRTLQPAQPERLLIAMLAYRETLFRTQHQAAAVQNLLPFARGAILDYLAQLVGVVRLEAQSARADFAFTAQAGHAGIVIPAGTRIGTADGRATFALESQIVMAAGATTATGEAACVTPGTVGNGYLPGAIAVIMDPVALVTAASNAGTTEGGADDEADEPFRERIRQAPSQYSTAGSAASYRFHALSAHPDVIDVAVTSTPGTGTVNVYPLAKDGAPSSAILDAVTAAVSADAVRPLTDAVNVVAPAAVGYTIDAALTLYADADASTAMAEANEAAEAFADAARAKLGHDVTMDAVIASLRAEGVYKVALSQPAADVIVSASEWANCTAITLTLAGTNNG